MIDVAKDIHPLTAFKRQTAKFARLLKKSQRPLVLTVEGKARFVVFDAKAYEAWKDRMETIEAVNEALAEEGKGRPAAEVHAELRKKYFGVPRPVPQTR
ncbi:MAG TPA: type II toxin-antitoxin system Phd/YefM family antitoxin [Terriglobia bacterium]|nr:type II toxin-antitoxin system Phd/YefM family antitoxin [Terriglobia bacterium]